MNNQIFINLPVADLPKAIGFYSAIGAKQNPQFSDETAACMVFSEAIHVMLLTHAKWSGFTTKPIVDAHTSCEVMLCLSCTDKAEVDSITQAAAANGGKADVNPPQDLGFMYGRSFEDVDGHTWELVFMDMAELPSNP